MFGDTLYHRIKKSLKKENKRFFYIGTAPPSVAAFMFSGALIPGYAKKGANCLV